MPLAYAYLNEKETRLAPPPRLANGGLYQGEIAKGDWGNVPVVPESHILTTQNLLSAQPPPGAVQHSVSTVRPGNNHVEHPFHVAVPGYNGLYLSG